MRSAASSGTLDMSLDIDPIGVGRRVATKVIVRVDHTALTRGHTVAGETCEIVGTGPVPVTQIQAMLDLGDTFAAAVTTDRDRVTTVAHIGHKPVPDTAAFTRALHDAGHDVTGARTARAPDAYQRTALDWTDPVCTVEGCDLPRQEIDHRADWAQTKQTVLDDLDGYCRHHHALKTRHNYQLAPGTGRRAMTPTATPVSTDPDPP